MPDVMRPLSRGSSFLIAVFLLVGWVTMIATARAGQTPEMLDLSGPWTVRLDPDDAGERGGWATEPITGYAITLPTTLDLAGIGYALDLETMTYEVDAQLTRWPSRPLVERVDEAGHLVRRICFLGAAWYGRDIVIPDDWEDCHIQLRLERVLWESTVFIDGVEMSRSDSLVAPHLHDLGSLEPGTHRLVVRVDNREIHPIGTIGHAYGPETQSRWNGILGDIELIAHHPIFIERVDVHPSADARSAVFRVLVRNTLGHAATRVLSASVLGPDGNVIGDAAESISLAPGRHEIEFTLAITADVTRWSEFTPMLYDAEVTLQAGEVAQRERVRFGFRSVRRDGRMMLLNDQTLFLRGTLDCCVYPRTGHPPMTVDAWRDVLTTIKRYGFNHVRFHTWCPPRAAFEAADELGIYLAPETPFWVDDWTTNMPEGPACLGRDAEVTAYIEREMARIGEAYGNHPSFLMFCIGNEFGGQSNWERIDQLLADQKDRDPRRLYNASTARRRVPSDDYWVTHRTASQSARGVGPAHTNWNFAAAVADADLPVVAHETGQRPVYPDFDDLLGKFDGPLLPLNYERFRRRLEASGQADLVPAFERASARFQQVLYKAEHEAFHRTEKLGGYQLLMLNDFTGQSEALVGVLDPFWEEKGVTTVADVRSWNSPYVLLARFDRYIWSSDETITASLQLANHGPAALPTPRVRWRVRTSDGEVHTQGIVEIKRAPAGAISDLGEIAVPLEDLPEVPGRYTLDVTMGPVRNSWQVWVYASEPPVPYDGEVTVTRDADVAINAVERGERALLIASGAENQHARRSSFLPVYWSGGWWGDRFSTLGLLCDQAHPALALFPNDGHSDWQWKTLLDYGAIFDLSATPSDLDPIVRGVPDFHYNAKLGYVFETRVGAGRLIVSGFDLDRSDAVTQQLRSSVLRYMQSDAFDPVCAMGADEIRSLAARPQPLPIVDRASVETLMERALYAVSAAALVDEKWENIPWAPSLDRVVRSSDGFSHRITSGGTWKDEDGAAWHGNPLGVELKLPPGTEGVLLIHMHDWNRLGRLGNVTVEDRKYTLGDHEDGVWAAIDVRQEDTTDGIVRITVAPSAGPNLMVSRLAFVPR
jgi:beta-galactosidase